MKRFDGVATVQVRVSLLALSGLWLCLLCPSSLYSGPTHLENDEKACKAATTKNCAKIESDTTCECLRTGAGVRERDRCRTSSGSARLSSPMHRAVHARTEKYGRHALENWTDMHCGRRSHDRHTVVGAWEGNHACTEACCAFLCMLGGRGGVDALASPVGAEIVVSKSYPIRQNLPNSDSLRILFESPPRIFDDCIGIFQAWPTVRSN